MWVINGMKQEKVSSINNQELDEKILTLCILNEIKNSELDLDIILCQIKLCEIELSHLKDNKPLFFQKEKLIKYNEDIEKVKKRLNKHYSNLFDEVDMIQRLKKGI